MKGRAVSDHYYDENKNCESYIILEVQINWMVAKVNVHQFLRKNTHLMCY